jgi:hypothetical protein
MIYPVDKFQTSDLKLFDTEDDAKKHDLNRVHEYISKKMVVSDKLRNIDKYHVIDQLFPDYETAKLFILQLNSILL